jgi:succinate-acetate transporter protein
MFLRKLDHWIGKTLFVPPVVKLCQLTRQSQFAVARLFWFMAALDAFYRAETIAWAMLWGVFSLVMMFSAARLPDTPTHSFLLFRMLAVTFLIGGFAKGAATGEWAGLEFWLFVLIAEYAAIIRTIPPSARAKSQPRESAAT